MEIMSAAVLLAVFLITLLGIFLSIKRMRQIKTERHHCPNCETLVSPVRRQTREGGWYCPQCKGDLWEGF